MLQHESFHSRSTASHGDHFRCEVGTCSTMSTWACLEVSFSGWFERERGNDHLRGGCGYFGTRPREKSLGRRGARFGADTAFPFLLFRSRTCSGTAVGWQSTRERRAGGGGFLPSNSLLLFPGN